MRRPLSALLLVLCLSGAAGPSTAQSASRDLDAIPLHLMEADSLQRVRAALPDPAARGPLRLAINVPMALNLDDGRWTQHDELAIWQARVQGIGATLLIAAFDRVALPPGAELRWSSVDGHTVQGPYTADDVDDRGGLWTALVPGDQALIELRVPAARRGAAALHLAALGYGVHELGRDGVPAKSGSCNIDVVCPQGNNWRDPIRSVVHLQIPGGLFGGTTTLCSGQLVNNLSQNGDPLLLTATHCGVTNGNARNVMAYYNFQTSSCGGVPDGSLTQVQRASQRLFSHTRSDHTLLRLDGPPPAAFNAYFSGFDANPRLPQSGVAIHHPSGDEKRISVFNTGSSYSDVILSGSATTVSAYRLNWAQGTTEGGSSGGGLFDPQRSLVGVLSAGNASCANPGGDDFFGRLDLAWDAGIDEFLDPGNSGQRSVPGRNASGSGGGGVVVPPDVPPSSAGGGGGSPGGALLAGLAVLAVLRRWGLSASRA